MMISIKTKSERLYGPTSCITANLELCCRGAIGEPSFCLKQMCGLKTFKKKSLNKRQQWSYQVPECKKNRTWLGSNTRGEEEEARPSPQHSFITITCSLRRPTWFWRDKSRLLSCRNRRGRIEEHLQLSLPVSPPPSKGSNFVRRRDFSQYNIQTGREKSAENSVHWISRND